MKTAAASEWRNRALLALFGLAASALLAEAAARILGLEARPIGRIFSITDGPSLAYPERRGHTRIDLYDSNPRGYFRVDLTDAATRADLVARGFGRVEEAAAHHPFGIAVKYNERGFRDRAFAPKPRGTRRVVVVGDSFTEGQGVRESDTLVRVLETQLQSPGRPVEVWNVGVRGHDLPDLVDLMTHALDLAPDAVLFAMVLNDGERSPDLAERWPRVNDAIMVRERPRPAFAERSRLFGFLWSRTDRWLTGRETVRWYAAMYSDENRDGWMRTRADLLKMRARAERAGASFGVALWPLMVGLDSEKTYPFHDAHAQIRRGCERAAIPFVDILPGLLGRRSSDYWVHESDLHPNEIANARAAARLRNFVSGLLADR